MFRHLSKIKSAKVCDLFQLKYCKTTLYTFLFPRVLYKNIIESSRRGRCEICLKLTKKIPKYVNLTNKVNNKDIMSILLVFYYKR